jgi:hypothetical protein
MCPQTKSASERATVSFVTSCQRVNDGVVWDVVDYHFRVTWKGDSYDIAVGIDGDWQDRLSRAELRTIAETWLLHRLEHFYEPLGEPRSCRRVMQVPFGVVDYWLVHRRLPH